MSATQLADLLQEVLGQTIFEPMHDLRLRLERLEAEQEDGWLDATNAAAYLGLSRNALHKHTSTRTIPFEQDGPGAKCWFKRSELDAWRRGQGRRG